MKVNKFGIEMQGVSSSNVAFVGYDNDTQTLYVGFLNGSTYIYKNVPYGEYIGLLNAPSVGSYLHRYIKNAYAYERIE